MRIIRMLAVNLVAMVVVAALLEGGVMRSTADAATPLGPVFQVHTEQTDAQSHAKVESDGSGDFVVVWFDYPKNVKARRFDATGAPQGDEFQVNQASYVDEEFNSDGATSVAMDPTGGFVVAWHGVVPPFDDPNSYYSHTFLRLFDADGNPRGDEFTTTTPEHYYDQAINPEIAIDDDGEFVVVWEGAGYWSPPEYPTEQELDESVFGQVYESDGTPKNGEFQADIYERNYQGDYGKVDVARWAAGNNFVVVWEGEGPGTGSGYYAYPSYGIHGRRFLIETGVAKQFKIATSAEGNPGTDPQIAMDPPGNFTVVWQDSDSGRIAARRFNRSAVRLGEPFMVSEDGGYQPAADADAQGNVVVLWEEGQLTGQVFDALGNRRGGEFTVGECVGCYSSQPDVATLGDDDFVVTWSGYGAAADVFGVFARRFAMDPLTEVLLPGKSLQIRDSAADVPELRSAAWNARGLNIPSPARGSADDPRCNDDPSGTVKASLRFFSNDSGTDSGAIDLPCEKWLATGPNSTDPLALQGFKYKDPQRTAGPCSTVVLKRSKLVKASCRGLNYDLVSGVDQGIVHAVLTLGQVQYCTSFDDFNGADGSDSLRFQGKDAPAPAVCPSP